MTAITRRQFGTSVAVGSVALFAASAPVFAAAQDASPVASPEMADVTAFADTGLTEITITASEFTLSASIPGAMAEGWYIMTLVNESETVASANYALLPEGTSAGELSSLVSTAFSGEGGELPEWIGSTTFAGGNVAAPGASTTTLAYLTPGKWTIFSSNTASIQSPSSFSILTADELEASYGVAQSATPVADASPVVAAPGGVVATVSVDITDAGIVPSGAPAGGEQILEVTNGGEQPHDMIILMTEDVLDPASAASLATSWIMGEEIAAVPVGGVGMLSPGQTGFTSIMVEPGNYAIFSALPDQNGGLQVDAGVVTVFTAQ